MRHPPIVGKYFLLGFILICGIILADQYSKWLVIDTLRTSPSASTDFLHWFATRKKIEFFINEREIFKTMTLSPGLNLVMVWNQGISFGLFDTNSPNMSLLFIAISLLTSLLLLLWLALATKKVVAVPLILIIGGALANVIDRVRFGAVADFIDVHAGQYHWPAFNLADSCISVGAAVLVLGSFISDRGKHVKKAR
ncbi:MAG: signal peptidase II [Proteobacteria bacterium]|nr:signal peptidase II [Pseudomonadota bacterium]